MLLGEEGSYTVATWGDIETFDPRVGEDPGTNIPTGAVFYYKGDYYLFRDYHYLTWNIVNDIDDETGDPSSGRLSNFISSHSIKIDASSFKTPGPSSKPGDVKLIGSKAYVFYPYTRFWEDYYNDSCWFEVVSK